MIIDVEFPQASTKEHQPVQISLCISETTARSMALDLGETVDVDVLDALFEQMVCDVEPIHDVLAQSIRDHTLDKPRDGDVLAARFGIDGEQPETLARIGAQYGLSRKRIRQVASRGISRVIGRTRVTGHKASVILQFRYPPEVDSSQLARLLSIETCATGMNRIAKELAYLKLRIAGHPDEDARNIAARVAHHVGRLSKHMARTRKKRDDDERRATAHLQRWLSHLEWPVTDQRNPARPVSPPMISARIVDLDEEGRGSAYLDRLGRDASFDSSHERDSCEF